MTAAPADGPRRGYPGTTIAAGVLATLFFPLVSLIAALVLLGRERDEPKRRDLRAWAWASGGWIGVQILAAGVIALAVWSGSSATKTDTTGPCVGGPKEGASATVRPDGKAVIPCAFSGSETIEFGK